MTYSFCASLTELLLAQFSGSLLFLLSEGFQTSLFLDFELANDNSRRSLAIGNGFQSFPLLLLFLSCRGYSKVCESDSAAVHLNNKYHMLKCYSTLYIP